MDEIELWMNYISWMKKNPFMIFPRSKLCFVYKYHKKFPVHP